MATLRDALVLLALFAAGLVLAPVVLALWLGHGAVLLAGESLRSLRGRDPY